VRKSHIYELDARQVARAVGAPCGVAALLYLLLQAACLLNALPPTRAREHPDQTILAYKQQVCHSRHPARILLTGDSACMTGVDPVLLSADLPGREPALNLGLIIGLEFSTYGEAVAEFLRANPSQVRCVVVLVTPQKLRNEENSAEFLDLWRQLGSEFRRGTDPGRRAPGLGRGELRERLLGRVLAQPLRGSGAEAYGFSSGLWDYLEAHAGAVLDFGSYHPTLRSHPPDYTVAPSLEADSRRFRSLIPRDVRLVAGIMPVPEHLVASDYRSRRDALLDDWNRWLQADRLLKRLPAVLPDGFFASGAHLNPPGQRYFTARLAAELRRISERPGESPAFAP
jgi:hypothetical protein